MADGLRSILFGRDGWLVEMPSITTPLSAELGQIEYRRDLGLLFSPYPPLVREDLHCALINWTDHHAALQDGGFEAALPDGLENLMVYGNSALRRHASESLANLQCLDRFHAGEGSVCRIWRGGGSNSMTVPVNR